MGSEDDNEEVVQKDDARARKKTQLRDYEKDKPLHKTIKQAQEEFKAKMINMHPFPTQEILTAEARNSFSDACIDRGVKFVCEDGLVTVVSLRHCYQFRSIINSYFFNRYQGP